MSNKKVVFAILSFAIVAALLTMARSPHFKMMNGEYIGKSTPPMGGSDAMYGMGDPSTLSSSPQNRKESWARDDAMGMSESSYYNPTMIEPRIAPGILQVGGGYDYGLNEANRSLDKNSYHGVVVDNVSEYMRDLKSYLQSVGGKVISSSQNTYDDMTYASLTVKVPADKFDEVTGRVAAKAQEVMNESINVSDVTGQRVGMEDQIKDLQEQLVKKEEELVAAKTDAAKKIVQYEIDSINRQIKSMQRYQETFAESVNFATISVTAADSEKFFDPEGSTGLLDEVKNAIKSLGKTGAVAAYFLIWVVVYAVIWLPLILMARWIWNKMTPATVEKK